LVGVLLSASCYRGDVPVVATPKPPPRTVAMRGLALRELPSVEFRDDLRLALVRAKRCDAELDGIVGVRLPDLRDPVPVVAETRRRVRVAIALQDAVIAVWCDRAALARTVSREVDAGVTLRPGAILTKIRRGNGKLLEVDYDTGSVRGTGWIPRDAIARVFTRDRYEHARATMGSVRRDTTLREEPDDLAHPVATTTAYLNVDRHETRDDWTEISVDTDTLTASGWVRNDALAPDAISEPGEPPRFTPPANKREQTIHLAGGECLYASEDRAYPFGIIARGAYAARRWTDGWWSIRLIAVGGTPMPMYLFDASSSTRPAFDSCD
jgi:hypothetical protein